MSEGIKITGKIMIKKSTLHRTNAIPVKSGALYRFDGARGMANEASLVLRQRTKLA